MDIAIGKNGRRFYVFPKTFDLNEALAIVAKATHKTVDDLEVRSAMDDGDEYKIYPSKKYGDYWAITRKEGK